MKIKTGRTGPRIARYAVVIGLMIAASTGAGAAFVDQNGGTAVPDPADPAGVTGRNLATQTDEEAILATDRAFHAASVTEKAKAWGAFAAEDATLSAGNGKQAIEAFFTKIYLKPGFRLDWEPAFVRVFGDYGISSGSYTQHLAGETGGDQRSTGTYLTVWSRQKDGTWRFVWDGGTMNKAQ